MCFTARFSGSSAGEHQPGVNTRDYVLLIILNKYVDTNMTRSPPDDLWRAFWQLNSFVRPVCAADIWRELRSIRPIIGGRTAKPVTQIYMWNEERRGRRKHLMLTRLCWIHTTKRLRRHQAALLTHKLCKENLFAAANERTDLSNSWLIIYPAGFMALINFPPSLSLSLSLPSIESLKSTCIWCW